MDASLDLPRLLHSLEASLSRLPTSDAEAEQLYSAAQELSSCASRCRDEAVHSFPPTVATQLAAVASRMASLNVEFQSIERGVVVVHLGSFCDAACIAMIGACVLGSQLGQQLSRDQAFRLAGGALLIFNVGVKQQELYDAIAGATGMPVEAANLLKKTCHHNVAAVHAAMRLLAEVDALGPLPATWGKSTARPQVVLPWLARVVTSMLHVCTSGVQLGLEECACFADLCTDLFQKPAFQAHQAALAAAPATHLDLVRLLQQHMLPQLAGAVEALGQADDIDAARQRACRALAVLPGALAGAAGCGQGSDAAAQRRAAQQLAMLLQADSAGSLLPTAARIARALPPLIQRAPAGACQLAHAPALVSSAKLLHMATGTAALAVEVSRQAGAHTGSAAGKAALAVELVRLTPHMAAALQALAASCEGGPEQRDSLLCEAAEEYAAVLRRAEGLDDDDAWAPQLPPAAEWAGILEAALRMVVLLAQGERMRTCRRMGLRSVGMLPNMVLLVMWSHGSRKLLEAFGSARARASASAQGVLSSPPDPQLTRQLWGLHSTGCRLLVWLVGEAGRRLRAELPELGAAAFTEGLNRVFCCACTLASGSPGGGGSGLGSASRGAGSSGSPGSEQEAPPGEGGGQLAALAAAHWAALQAADSPAGARNSAGEAGGDGSLQLTPMTGHVLAFIAQFCPAAADERFVRFLGSALECGAGAQDGDGWEENMERLQLLHGKLQAGAFPPRVIADLASSGLLGRLVRRAQSMAPRRFSLSPAECNQANMRELMLAVMRLECCREVVAALSSAACLQLAQGAEGGVGGSGHAATAQQQQQQQQWYAGLQAACNRVPQLPPQTAALADTNAVLLEAVGPAEDLAALLQQHWAQPQAKAGNRLALGQAAAQRSCANLRCPNVGLEGGPAAGEGRGCKRCGACRAVWYCDTECSHADWRAGHRRVCAALGAAQQAAANS